MMYQVKDIWEPDFGCEGIPGGQEPCCDVILEDRDSGKVQTIRVPDAELYQKEIIVGSLVTVQDGKLLKSE